MGYTTGMLRKLNIELFGPCSDEDGMQPVTGDTVAFVSENGRVRFLTISGANQGPEGMVLYAMGGEKLLLSDCYFVFTVDESSAE